MADEALFPDSVKDFVFDLHDASRRSFIPSEQQSLYQTTFREITAKVRPCPTTRGGWRGRGGGGRWGDDDDVGREGSSRESPINSFHTFGTDRRDGDFHLSLNLFPSIHPSSELTAFPLSPSLTLTHTLAHAHSPFPDPSSPLSISPTRPGHHRPPSPPSAETIRSSSRCMTS
jgi:hypothetical protein